MTPNDLLELADRAEKRYRESGEKRVEGDTVVLVKRFDASALQQSDDALACAEWMENAGVSEIDVIGPFADRKVEWKQGDRVRIKAGATCFSTDPNVPQEGRARLKSGVVTVFSSAPGWVDLHRRGRRGAPEIRDPKVTWAGSGGYWWWTDARNVEDA